MNCDAKLRKWLSHKPRPVVVACDDQVLDAPATDRGWAEVAETIEQLRPDRIVLRDGKGKVLRAKSFEEFFPPEPSELQEVPKATTPEQQTLQQFAVLLANAHTSAAATHGPILSAAMEFTERLSARLAKTEAELDRARATIAQLDSELAELQAKPQTTPGDDLTNAFVQGMQMKAAAGGNVTPINGGQQ
jgi:hypothetical protein